MRDQNEARPASILPGFLSLDTETVDRLIESYRVHLHVLHPFLEWKYLQALKRKFCQNHGSHQMVASLAAQSSQPQPPRVFGRISNESCEAIFAGSKRKHSCQLDSSALPLRFEGGACVPALEYTVHSAIFLLVLAIGKVCEGWQQLQKLSYASPNSSRLDKPATSIPALEISRAPGYGAIKLETETFGFGPQSYQPNRVAFEDASRHAASWIDTDDVPGIQYHTYAKQILGCIPSTSGLPRIQAFLLVALYEGQLARPIASLHWLQQAASACARLVDEYALLIASLVFMWSKYVTDTKMRFTHSTPRRCSRNSAENYRRKKQYNSSPASGLVSN